MKWKNRFLAFSLVLFMIFSFAGFGVIPSEGKESSDFTHLKNVPDGYTAIYTKEDLNNIRKNLKGKYILMNDIEFSVADFAEGGAFYNDGAGWTPIGTCTDPEGESVNNQAFSGVLDGNGYSVKNLIINADGVKTPYVGLFGFAEKASIRNLGMIGSSIKVTIQDGGVYETCGVGGIVGGMLDGTMKNCYNKGNLESFCSGTFGFFQYVGGILGYANASSLRYCYNTGDISITGDYVERVISVGGILGYALDAKQVNDCYNAGHISIADSVVNAVGGVGGILGSNGESSYVSAKVLVRDCYNVGNLPVSNDAILFVGGLVGQSASSDMIISGYCLNNVRKGVGNLSYSISLSSDANLRLQETFRGFDFDQIWTMEGDPDYPYPELNFDRTLEKASISKKPEKVSYLIGEEFDPTGMVVTANYDEKMSVSGVDYTFEYDFSTAGNKTVKVFFAEKLAGTVSVRVSDPADASSDSTESDLTLTDSMIDSETDSVTDVVTNIVSSTDISINVATDVSTDEVASLQTLSSDTTLSQPRKTGNTLVIVIVVCVSVLACSGGVVAVLVLKKKKTDQ